MPIGLMQKLRLWEFCGPPKATVVKQPRLLPVVLRAPEQFSFLRRALRRAMAECQEMLGWGWTHATPSFAWGDGSETTHLKPHGFSGAEPGQMSSQ